VPKLDLDLEKKEASEEDLLVSVYFYSKNKEGITSVVKKREEGIRSRPQEM
jgi:hypothetical protein